MADKISTLLWWIVLASPLFGFTYAWKIKSTGKVGRLALGIYITLAIAFVFGVASCLVSMTD